jgi:mono/diheme cytochrome c family protein/glucose/arabinose dehydrogenase
MKKILIPLLFAGLAVVAYFFFFQTSSPVFQIEEGYRYLYDGKSLEGWRVIGGESSFEVDQDDIVGRHGPGENTFLRTVKTYADFSLKMQMRWDEPGNSGALFRARQRGGDGRAYGYQFELDHTERSWSGGIYDEARRGWLADLENNPAAREAIRASDWNDIEIKARGTSLKTWINGVPAADIIDGLTAEGFIALQVHSGDTGVMRWRRIRIKELPGMLVPGDSLMAAAEWRSENLGPMQFSGNSFGAPLPEGPFWITPRRQFSDALVRMTVPACDQPTTIRVRYLEGEGSEDASFAEVKIFADRAQGRLVTSAGEEVMEPVTLEKSAQHRLVAVTRGTSVVLTVGETDALRLGNTGLVERGQLRIQPARCGESFRVSDLDWLSLKQGSAEPLFYQTLDNQPAPVLSPEEALGAFITAPGFEIELVAAEPLVEDPVAMAWDEYGRLYVVEMRGYMPDAYGTGSEEPVGQVVRLEDTDGDGRMDTSDVFLGELVNPRAVAVVNEGVLVGEPPNLWLCELPTRDAVCANKRSIGGYATDVTAANVEHMENGLRQGLDNWLYNSKSARRLRIEKGGLVEQEGLSRGQWGITRDRYGRWLYNHNSTWLQADYFAAEDLVKPGNQSYPLGLGVNLTQPAEVFSVRVNPGVNRAYLDNTLRADGRLHKATGVSGLVAYRGDQFPQQYRNDVFVPEVAANVVAQFAMAEDGMALRAEQRLYDDDTWGKREFLGSTDERFRPVDAMNGPDGALYIIDMYRGIVQDAHFLTDELREQIFQRELETPIGMGRIWRIRHSQGKADRSVPALAAAESNELVAALAHPNGWARDTAQRLLLARDDVSREALEQQAQGDNTLAALHALWTLQGRGELQRELVLKVAVSGDLQRQLQALRAGSSRLTSEDLLQLAEKLQGAPEALAMQLAFALGNHADDPAIRAHLENLLTARLESPYVRQAVVRAVDKEELVFLREYLASGRLSAVSEAGEAALMALAGNAYRNLRGDITSTEPANPVLQELLSLAESRSGDSAWQQIAMLSGFAGIAGSEGFVPAALAAAPDIFTDSSIGEQDPLWNARLAGRAAFTWPGDELAMGITPLSPEQLKLMALGEAFYAQCATCHGASGGGTAGLAPSLAGAAWVTGPPEWLARIILQGINGPLEVNGESWSGIMPPHGHLPELDDAALAGLMTYLRRAWGNKSDPVSTEVVAAIRSASADRKQPWTAAELQEVPFDRGYQRFVGKYSISFITMTVSEKPEGLYMAVPMYGEGLLQPVTDTVFMAETGGESSKLEFIVEENGAVNKMIMYRDGQEIPVMRKQD